MTPRSANSDGAPSVSNGPKVGRRPEKHDGSTPGPSLKVAAPSLRPITGPRSLVPSP